ncbi:MAG: trigger factor [Bacteroidales bacterium]|jgi:trigger factor|nr:trigger factor [Bacteroidales bacterium]
MNVTKEMTGNLTAEIRIELVVDDYQTKVDEQLRKYRRELKMPGFRPGQVPVGLVKKMYEKPIRAEEIQRMLNDSLYNFIDTEKLKILGEPLPVEDKNKGLNFDHAGDYNFYFEVGLQPSFELDLKAIKPTYYTIEPTEDMLNKFVEDIRRRFGKFESPEAIGETDVVFGEMQICDEEGNVKEDETKITTSFSVDKIALETIKKKVVGTKVNESVCFNVQKAFKDATDRASMLKMDIEKADTITEVKFTPTSISSVTLAEMNEEFFEMAYPKQDITTVEAFKAKAKQDLSGTYAREADRYFFNDVSKALIDSVKIDLPDDFLKRWIASSMQDELEKAKVFNEYDAYRDSIKWQMIEGKIVQEQSISVTEEEIKEYYKTSLLANYFPVMEGESEEDKKARADSMEKIATNLLQNKEQTRQVFDYIYENKLIEALKATITSAKKTISIDEFSDMVKKKNK